MDADPSVFTYECLRSNCNTILQSKDNKALAEMIREHDEWHRLAATPSEPAYDPEKYVVFKREDWEAWLDNFDLGTMPPSFNEHGPLDPATYFLLRQRDIASVTALRSYVQGLLVILDVNTRVRWMTKEESTHLLDLCDAITQLATDWDSTNETKVPD